jgi:ferrous iron transport protein A
MDVMKSLDQLEVGERGMVVEVDGQPAITQRLMEMGLIEGEIVEVVGRAPLGDPVELQVYDYRLSVRKNEAALVRVQVVMANSGSMIR